MLKNNLLTYISHKVSFGLVFVFIILGLLVRLYSLDAPLGDWHSWRQADTSAVSWLLNSSQASLFKPRFFDISSIPSGKPNPNGWRFVEFPIYNLLQVGGYNLIKTTSWFNYPFEAAGRLVNIIFWLISGWFWYRLISKLGNHKLGLTVLFFHLYLPFNIYYSRTILPDPLMVSLGLISLYFLTLAFLRGRHLHFLLGFSLTALSLLVKPYAVFIIYPYLASLIWLKRSEFKTTLRLVTGSLLALIPLLVWRWWMQFYPEGIPANKWLFNAGDMRLKPVWWRWLFYERIAKLISGGWLTSFLTLSLLTPIISLPKQGDKKLLLSLTLSLSLGGLAFLIVFARGNIQHDYYQAVISPSLSLLLGWGVYLFTNLITSAKTKFYLKLVPFVGMAAVIALGLGSSWYQIKEYYKINDLNLIKTLDQLKDDLPPEAKVVADYQGNSLLLYHLKRFGWPTLTEPITQLKQRGADYYLSPTANQVTDQLALTCQDIIKYQDLILINLNSCRL